MARQPKLPSSAALAGAMRAAVDLGYRIKNIILRRDGYELQVHDSVVSDADAELPPKKKPPLVL